MAPKTAPIARIFRGLHGFLGVVFGGNGHDYCARTLIGNKSFLVLFFKKELSLGADEGVL